MFEKEAEEWWNNEYSPSLYDNVSEVWRKGAEFGYNKANEILKSAVKVLVSTLDDTLWDEGHPGYSIKPGYNCPECACKDCYRVSCKYNKSELFKQLNTDFPELFKKGV